MKPKLASKRHRLIRTKKAKTMCTLEKRGNIFILTLTGDNQHRLNPTLLSAIQSALTRIRQEVTTSPSSATPSALITTAHGKFFSNGYDLDWARIPAQAQARRDRAILADSMLRSIVKDLLTFPMPTIAAVTGHASAAGFILALSHDYVLMRSDRGFLYMSELDINLVIPRWFVAVVDAKVGSPAARREVVMKAAKLTAKDAVRLGVVESDHGSAAETVEAAAELAEGLVKRGWDGHVYADNRKNFVTDLIRRVEDISEHNTTGSRL